MSLRSRNPRAFLESIQIGARVELFVDERRAWYPGVVTGIRRGTRGPYTYLDIDLRPASVQQTSLRIYDDDSDAALASVLVAAGAVVTALCPGTFNFTVSM
jgi:hypothetical protein